MRENERIDLYEKLDEWHEEDEYEKIVETIFQIPEEERDYKIIGRLASAYNNLKEYDKAIEQLELLREQEKDEKLWNYCMGYAYFYKHMEEEAFSYFFHALALYRAEETKPDEAIIDSLIDFIEECQVYIREKNNEPEPELYSEEEMEAIQEHIEKYFGQIDGVMHELISPDIHIDLLCVPPSEERDYYQIFTMGMGAHQMNVPEEVINRGLDRAELMIALPKDWDISNKDEKYYWPLRWLKIMARLPIEQDTWLGWGHTAANGEPFADNTKLSGIILITPCNVEEGASECILPNGKCVNFYQMLPIYEEEMEFKLKQRAAALLDKCMDANIGFVVEVDRVNTCAGDKENKKKFKLTAEDIKPLLENWKDGENCIATDRIVVDGCKIGYMYREEPNDEQDSGWRFMAGDESEDYMDNPENSGIYKLNTICNYDEEILPFLNTPYGKAYYKEESGDFKEEEFLQ